MKVLCTGDREWVDLETIVAELEKLPSGTIIIHGACRGADVACGLIAEALGFVVRPYPADWSGLERAAGPIRNQHMVNVEHRTEEPIDLCLAFHDDLLRSKGTKDMIKRIEKAKIPWKQVKSRFCCSVQA